MKVLMINDEFDRIDGVNTYISSLEKSLSKKGIEVFHLSLSSKRSFKTDHTKVIRYSFRKSKLRWFISENIFDFSLYKKLRKYILDINPDMIHLHNIYKSTKTILFACRGYKKVQTIHNSGIVCPLGTLFIERDNSICSGKKNLRCYLNGCLKLQSNLLDHMIFDNTFLKRLPIDVFICPSNYLLDICKKVGNKRSILLPHFTVKDNGTIHHLADSTKNISPGYFLFVGRIENVKGVFHLLDAFEIALKENNDLRLVLVGVGSVLKDLKKRVHNKKLDDSIMFIGEVKYDLISKYYVDSSAVVIPSIWNEGFGLVALEAMNHSKPIIAFESGALPEIIVDGKTGFIVKRGDIQGLAEKILFLSKNGSLALKLGLKGRKLLEKRYDQKMYIDKLIATYRSCLD